MPIELNTLCLALSIPVCDWMVPELQSGELRIQQNLPAKLTTKLTYEPQFFETRHYFWCRFMMHH